MGHKEVFLTKQVKHTTLLQYKIENIIKNINGKEIIGWNFLGYDWDMSRDNVIINITLPVSIGKNEKYSYAEVRYLTQYILRR